MRLLLAAVLGFTLVGCSQHDNDVAKEKLHKAGKELNQELTDGSRKLSRDAHRASEELKHDANKVKSDIHEKTDSSAH